jgi:hypothetical protein
MSLKPVRKIREQAGALVAELPIAMWVLFLGLAIPLADLATIGLRSTFVVAAAHDAAHAAARCKSFQTDVDTSHPSAQTTAQSVASNVLTSFKFSSNYTVTTQIVVTNISTGKVTRQTTPLLAPADTNSAVYDIEVVVSAQVDPLVTYSSSMFGKVPGLSAPMTMSCGSREFAEFPQGLNQ